MPDSPRRDPRARPSIWAPFGWAAILTLILTGAISFSHSLPWNIGESLTGILLLPAGIIFYGMGGGGTGRDSDSFMPNPFLATLSVFPDWFFITLLIVSAYFYSLVLMMLIWAVIRLAKRVRSAKPASNGR